MAAAELLSNGLRVLITNRCNYKCFFCHSEGIDPNSRLEEKIDSSLIAGFVRAGVRNLTISGGEPLVAFPALLELLDELRSILSEAENHELELTIVTNGSLLTGDKLEALRDITSDFGKLRFNISLHSPVPDVYDAVTKTVSKHRMVISNITNAMEMGFEVCLNFVLLRNFNERENEIDSIMEFSSSLGVPRIKIIEFLVTDLNKNFYSSFSRLDSVVYNHKHRASQKHSSTRRTVRHHYPEYNLDVDYTRCTCALGCANCIDTREIEVTPDNKILGCIALPAFLIESDETPVQIADRAWNQLRCMEEKYGKFSPSLVFSPENVQGIGRFTMKTSDSMYGLFRGEMVATYRKYRTYDLGKLPKGEYDFLLVEFDEDTHSKLVCYRHSEKVVNGTSWTELDYLDPVYEFSRTRAEVNRKKIQAMGFELPEPLFIEEDSVKLNHLFPEYPASLKRLVENGTERIILEILRPDSKNWKIGEPLHSAMLLADQYGLEFSSS